jgi:hypothetical protein
VLGWLREKPLCVKEVVLSKLGERKGDRLPAELGEAGAESATYTILSGVEGGSMFREIFAYGPDFIFVRIVHFKVLSIASPV